MYLYFLIIPQTDECLMVQCAIAGELANVRHGLAIILKHNLKEKQMVL